MPLLYGEGENAFVRLQEEIIKNYEDESIFAWLDHPRASTSEGVLYPILAPSPSYFIYRSQSSTITLQLEDRKPYRMSSQGIELETTAVEVSNHGHEFWPEPIYVVQMNCGVKFLSLPNTQPCLLGLAKCPEHRELYARAFTWMIGENLWRRIVDRPDVRERKLPRSTYYIATSWEHMSQARMPDPVVSADSLRDITTLDELFERHCEDTVG